MSLKARVNVLEEQRQRLQPLRFVWYFDQGEEALDALLAAGRNFVVAPRPAQTEEQWLEQVKSGWFE